MGYTARGVKAQAPGSEKAASHLVVYAMLSLYPYAGGGEGGLGGGGGNGDVGGGLDKAPPLPGGEDCPCTTFVMFNCDCDVKSTSIEHIPLTVLKS